MPRPVSPAQRDSLLETLRSRFMKTSAFHPHTDWESVLHALYNTPEKLSALYAMETSGGEPCVVHDPEHPSQIVFMDCAAESPAGRRSLCYDQEALLARKANPPKDSAAHMAETMGVALLSEAQYRALQAVGSFDLKTSSWVQTPPEVRRLGGALFCDKRYGRVFVYHNGADAYYGSRGFRGYLIL